jgi:hypothetical protein
VLTNIFPATVCSNFRFYLYSVDSKDGKDNQIESRGRRLDLFKHGMDRLLDEAGKSKEDKEQFMRVIFFAGSFFYSAREIPGLEPEHFPKVLCKGEEMDGDTVRIYESMAVCLYRSSCTAIS